MKPLEALDRHWFAPASLRNLGLVRIVLVGGQLLVLLLPTLLFFRDRGTLGEQLWRAEFGDEVYVPLPIMKVFLLPFGGARPGPLAVTIVWYATLAAGAGALVGRFTRTCLLLFAAGSTFMDAHRYSFGELHHTATLITIALWTLVLTPCGARLSWDALRRRTRRTLQAMTLDRDRTLPPSPEARWPLRLVQWLLALAYLSAGLTKLKVGGLQWFNGHTLAHYLALDGIRGDNPIGVWAATAPLFVLIALSVITVVWELTFFVAVLVPRVRWLYLLTGIGIHVGIWITQKAPFWQFMLCYIVFLERDRSRGPAPEARAGPWKLIYDGLCPLCLRTLVWVDAADRRRRVQFVDLEREWGAVTALAPELTREQARAAIHLVHPDGRIERGFFAFRALARKLPRLWILLPLLYAPFAKQVGPRVYALIARLRPRRACDTDACSPNE